MGINLAHRIGCTKPAGSSSAWLGTTSGIHSAYFEFGLRRVRVDKSQPIAKYLINKCGLGAPNSYSVVEQDQFIDSNIVISVPVNHEHGILRSQEKAVDLLKRVKHVHKNWIQPTHRSGPNTHNVSVTVSYRPEEIDEVTDWMVENRDSYCGIALLPYDPTTYPKPPLRKPPNHNSKPLRNNSENFPWT